jgi:hypothetical protein
LVASFAIFGEHEWAARLVPIGYTIATWWLLFFAVRRYWGPRYALAAGVVYALTPLNITFAGFVNHEQGGIFFCLALLLSYLRWLERPAWRWILLTLLMVTMAVQWDWPGYYVAFAIAVHCCCLAVRKKAPKGWLTFFVIFCAVTSINFLGFFAWIYFLRGDFADMINAFAGRSSGPRWSHYFSRTFGRIETHYGLPIALLVALSLLDAAFRAFKLRLQRRSLIPIAFAFAGLIQYFLFREAGHLHSYWTYYWSPAIAIGAAWITVGLADVLKNLGGKSLSPTPAGEIAFALVLSAFVAIQAPLAVRSWRALANQGSGADCGECYFQREETLWLRSLGSMFDRNEVRYLLHKSVHEPRIELQYYLDAPNRQVDGLEPYFDTPIEERIILLVDRMGLSGSESVAALAREHPSWIYKDRFYAIEVSRRAEENHSYELELAEPSILRWWLTSHIDRAALQWVEEDPS